MALELSLDCSNHNNTYALKPHPEYPGHWPHAVAWVVICGIVLTNLVMSIPDIIKTLKQWYSSYLVLSGEVPDAPDCIPLQSDHEGNHLLSKDSNTNQENSNMKASIQCCSLVHNWSILLNTDSPHGTIGCLHGLRCLAMSNVVLFHSIKFGFPNGCNYTWSLHVAKNLCKEWAHQAVVTFFVMSSCLFTKSLLKMLDRDRGNGMTFLRRIPKLYMSRYFRLVVVVAVYVLVSQCYPQIVDILVGQWENSCQQYWWTNIIFISNFVSAVGIGIVEPFGGFCLGHLWFLACDLQLYFITPIFAYAFYRNTYVGLVMAVVAFVSSVMFRVLMDIYGLGDTTWTYQTPIARLSNWIIGICLGFILYKFPKFKPRMWHVCTGWLICCPLLIFLLTCKAWVKSPLLTDGIEADLHALVISWIILACHSGAGGFVNSFLCWKIWTLISQVTYVCYVIHPTFLSVAFHAMGLGYYHADDSSFNIASVLVCFVASLGMAIPAAFIVRLFVEIPASNLTVLAMKSFFS